MMKNTIDKRSSFRLIPRLLHCIFTTNSKNIGLLYSLFCCKYTIILIKIFNMLNVNIFTILNNWKFDDIFIIKFIILIILYVLFPIMFCGFSNIIIPFILKCDNLMFPRINNISFWIFCLSFLIMLESVLCETSSEIYSFSSLPYTLTLKWELLFISSLYLYSFSLFLQSINYICTIIKAKNKQTIFEFAILLISFFLIFYLPILPVIVESILFKNNCYYCFFNFFFENFFSISLNFQLYWFFLSHDLATRCNFLEFWSPNSDE